MNTLIISGAPSAAFVPGVLATLGDSKAAQSLNIIVTRSARSFVTPLALRTFSQGCLIGDRFGEVDHQAIARESKKVFVYPATFNFVNKVASGITDSLSLMVAQLSLKKLRLYVSLPEGLAGNETYESNRSTLQESGVDFIEADRGLALSLGRLSPGGCPSPNELWHDLKTLTKEKKANEHD